MLSKLKWFIWQYKIDLYSLSCAFFFLAILVFQKKKSLCERTLLWLHRGTTRVYWKEADGTRKYGRTCTHPLHHLHTLPFLKGERSVSRGGNGEPLLWLITRQGPGRTQCHFHCQTHYTTEEDSPPLLLCPLHSAVVLKNPLSACSDESKAFRC